MSADMFARYIVGDSLSVLRSLPSGSVQSVITSPPYLAKRAYLSDDHPDKPHEIGQEATPAGFLAALLRVTDELWRIVRDDGTIWINLGDTLSGGVPGWPLSKSVCWIPQLFGASLAYGHNLLSGEPCQRWVTRPPVTWCKPNPPVGEIIDKFREATELIVWAAKTSKPSGYYFDLDALRVMTPRQEESLASGAVKHGKMGHDPKRNHNHGRDQYATAGNPKGVPPLDWWEIPTSPYPGAHFATYPPALITRPVVASCPPGGVILDPFAGSGTTLAVAHGHGRSSIGVDLDERNADLARQRVGMWLTVEHHQPAEAPTA